MILKSILRSFSYEHLKTVHFGNAHARTAFIEVRHVKGSSKCKVRAIEGSTNPNDLHLSLPPSVSRAPEGTNLSSSAVLSCLAID